MTDTITREETFRKGLEKLINRYSQENGSNTPDYLLANFLINSLIAFDDAVNSRSIWYSQSTGSRFLQPSDPEAINQPCPETESEVMPHTAEATATGLHATTPSQDNPQSNEPVGAIELLKEAKELFEDLPACNDVDTDEYIWKHRVDALVSPELFEGLHPTQPADTIADEGGGDVAKRLRIPFGDRAEWRELHCYPEDAFGETTFKCERVDCRVIERIDAERREAADLIERLKESNRLTNLALHVQTDFVVKAQDERDQLKAERDKLRDELEWTKKELRIAQGDPIELSAEFANLQASNDKLVTLVRLYSGDKGSWLNELRGKANTHPARDSILPFLDNVRAEGGAE